MKNLLFLSGLILGAESLHAFQHTIHNKSNHELFAGIGYEGACIPVGAENEFSSGGGRFLSGIKPGQSVAVDSGACRLNALWIQSSGLTYLAPAGGDGDAEYEITESAIKKIK